MRDCRRPRDIYPARQNLYTGRLRANFLPNERNPGIHLGLGLGHYTPFHIDLALTGLEVLLESPVAAPLPLYPSIGLRTG